MKKVLIAAPTELMRNTLRAVLDKEDDFYIVGCISDAEELRFLFSQCDVALIDAVFQGEATAGLLRELNGDDKATKTVVVGVPDSPPHIIRFLEAGALGYVLENEAVDDLVRKVRATVREKPMISPRIAAVMMNRITTLANAAPPTIREKKQRLDSLTPRQQEVLQGVSKGWTNKQIADALFIECGTVKNHVHHILKKLNVSSRYEAAHVYKQEYQQERNEVATAVS